MASGESAFDLINLSGPLTVEAILRTLQRRFNDGHCYSQVGPVLLCVNPYEPPSHDMHSVLKALVQQLISDLPEAKNPRSVVFSGVSSSGKSFTADQLLVKMFQCAQKTDWLQDLRRYWQVSSVVLKALGSAATESNKDSSRMGRMVDFQFSGLQIVKVKINCFFLDQTRLVSTNPQEQNYHIFYQLMAGLSPEEKDKFFLGYHDLGTLHYLSQGQEPREPTQQLRSHFEAWKSSLAQLGIPLTDVVKVLVSVLLLGNILFYEAKNQELSLQGMEDMQAVASLLGLQPSLLQQALTLRTYHSSHGQLVRSQCSAAAANGARDALAKALYIRTVVAIMRRINTLLRGAVQRQAGMLTSPRGVVKDEHMVHVLDLFGFECNEVNSLEQICVNWTAEVLQHYYTQALFTATTQECQEEGVDPLFESSLYDCSPCLELINGQQGGLLQLLNQETLSPRVSDQDIRLRMKDKFHLNPCFVPAVGSSSTFTVKHFCGEVVYDTYSLLNANADTVADDIVAIFNSKDCKFGFVAHLFAVELNRDLHSDGTPKGQMCRITPAYLQHATHSELRQPTTYAQDFQSNLGDVFDTLKKSKPYFIRCLKSNSSQTPGHFDREVVTQQIQHNAVFETVDLIQTGFIHSETFENFIRRYRLIAPDAFTRMRSKSQEMTEDLLHEFMKLVEDPEIAEESYAMGKTKVFLNEEFRSSLEMLRGRILSRAAVCIQAAARCFLCRKHWPQLRFSLQQARLQGEAQSQLNNDSSERAPAQNWEKAFTVRNYTIVGNYKVGFPQWRVMKCHYPDTGPPMLHAGDEVFVIGRSQKRGYLIVDCSGKQLHLPHHYTELRLSPPSSPPPPLPPTTVIRRTDPGPQISSDL